MTANTIVKLIVKQRDVKHTTIEPLREECRARGIDPSLARRRTPHGTGLGVFRWPVERTLGWLHQFRRLGYRRDRLLNLHQAFVTLACCVIALRFL